MRDGKKAFRIEKNDGARIRNNIVYVIMYDVHTVVSMNM